MANKDHTRIGAEFQEKVRQHFEEELFKGSVFESEIAIKIGEGKLTKEHKYDIVCSEKNIAIECKCYTWTSGGNVPSGKIRGLNEAAFFLSFLKDYEKYIVIRYSYHPTRKQTLAEYYFETYRHLLGNIHVAEFNPGASAEQRFRVLPDSSVMSAQDEVLQAK